MKRTALQRNPQTTRDWVNRSQRSTARKQKPRAVSPASRSQRAKTRLMGLCVSCGALATDSMHLWPRSLGGCDEAACTLPACRSCHSLFDRGELDLSGVLALPEFVAERVHMESHASFDACIRRLRGHLLVTAPVNERSDG